MLENIFLRRIKGIVIEAKSFVPERGREDTEGYK
jgi:hypothetical protein